VYSQNTCIKDILDFHVPTNTQMGSWVSNRVQIKAQDYKLDDGIASHPTMMVPDYNGSSNDQEKTLWYLLQTFSI
jgi:hypothetical protein